MGFRVCVLLTWMLFGPLASASWDEIDAFFKTAKLLPEESIALDNGSHLHRYGRHGWVYSQTDAETRVEFDLTVATLKGLTDAEDVLFLGGHGFQKDGMAYLFPSRQGVAEGGLGLTPPQLLALLKARGVDFTKYKAIVLFSCWGDRRDPETGAANSFAASLHFETGLPVIASPGVVTLDFESQAFTFGTKDSQKIERQISSSDEDTRRLFDIVRSELGNVPQKFVLLRAKPRVLGIDAGTPPWTVTPRNASLEGLHAQILEGLNTLHFNPRSDVPLPISGELPNQWSEFRSVVFPAVEGCAQAIARGH